MTYKEGINTNVDFVCKCWHCTSIVYWCTYWGGDGGGMGGWGGWGSLNR